MKELELRKDLDNMFFLIPGYGAQGGTAEDVAIIFKRWKWWSC